MRSLAEHQLFRHALVVFAFLIIATQVHCASRSHGEHALVDTYASRGSSVVRDHQPVATQQTNRTSSPWCQPATGGRSQWQTLSAPGRAVLSKGHVIACSVLHPRVSQQPELLFTRTQLLVGQQQGGPATQAELYHVLLWDCDAQFWQLSGLQDEEHVCMARTAGLRASCNEWLLRSPLAGEASSTTCAPPNTTFGTTGHLAKRVLVLQAHWRINSSSSAAEPAALRLPNLELRLGAQAAEAAEEAGHDNAAAAAAQPALLGSFVGSGIYPPSSISHGLQAFTVQQSAHQGISTADLACSKRCTFLQLGRAQPRPVNVVGYQFVTFDRAVAVSFEVQRGWAGRSAGAVQLGQLQWRQAKAASGGLVPLQQPFKLYPGDVVRWRCSYNTSDLQPGSKLQGGHSSAAGSLQEQCTVVLHYWPRVESMRGCAAATLSDGLRGESMCSQEARDLLSIADSEQQQLPIRRMYNERSFPAGVWMGGWKATLLVLSMAAVLSCLWGSHTLLSNCKWLGSWHRRFLKLAPGQQRNVSLYITHLLLDTAVLIYACRPLLEIWLGFNDVGGAVGVGGVGFTYIVACYALELTWRRRVDVMLAIHHVGTIIIITMYAGEFLVDVYRVANVMTVLAAFALMEQPTYIALLLKRMLPASSRAAVRAARFGYLSWFVLKGLSVLLAVRLLCEDWELMQTWVKVNFVLTWVLASLVQGWSGMIQYGIYKHVRRDYTEALLQQQQALEKKTLLLCTSLDGSSEEEEQGNLSPMLASPGSSVDCMATVDDVGANAGPYAKLGSTGSVADCGVRGATDGFKSAFACEASSSGRDCAELCLSPCSSSGSDSGGSGIQQWPATGCGGSGDQLQAKVQGSMHPPPRRQQQGGGKRRSSSSSSGGSGAGASGSSYARRQAPTLQRRTKSGALNMMECGLSSQDD